MFLVFLAGFFTFRNFHKNEKDASTIFPIMEELANNKTAINDIFNILENIEITKVNIDGEEISIIPEQDKNTLRFQSSNYILTVKYDEERNVLSTEKKEEKKLGTKIVHYFNLFMMGFFGFFTLVSFLVMIASLIFADEMY